MSDLALKKLSESEEAHLRETLRTLENDIAEAEPVVKGLKIRLEAARSHLSDLKAADRALSVMESEAAKAPSPS